MRLAEDLHAALLVALYGQNEVFRLSEAFQFFVPGVDFFQQFPHILFKLIEKYPFFLINCCSLFKFLPIKLCVILELKQV